MGVNMIVKVVQIQRQINVNVVKPGFSDKCKYNDYYVHIYYRSKCVGKHVSHLHVRM